MTKLRRMAVLVVCAVVLSTITSCAPRGDNLVEGVTIPGVSVLRMLDEKDGWALRGARVLRTSDGGRVWKDVGPTGNLYPEGASATFLDGSHAWLVIASPEPSTAESELRVFRTSDGGATWEETTVAEQAVAGQLTFLDPEHGWLLLRQGMAMMHEQVTLLSTSDGGKSWMKVAVASIEGEPGRLPFSGDKSGLAFSDENTGFVTGYWPVPGDPYFFATPDGGRTWHKAELPLPSGYEEADYFTYAPVFDRSGAGIMAATVSGDGRSLVFYSTSDGGKTWTSGTPLPLGETREEWDAPAPGLIVAATGRELHVSTDAGKTWTDVAPGIELGEGSVLTFVSEKTGWALVQGKLMVTRDGGKTWKRT